MEDSLPGIQSGSDDQHRGQLGALNFACGPSLPQRKVPGAEPAAALGSPGRLLLGVGSNLESPSHQISGALRQLAGICLLEACSSVYRTEPVGYRNQPDFLNLVVRGSTRLSPLALLNDIHRIERLLGRVRSFPNAPRTIDIDILAYDELVLASPTLTIPHPRLHDRAFVLVPLAEVAPDWRHPVLGSTATELLENLRSSERVEWWSEPLEWSSG